MRRDLTRSELIGLVEHLRDFKLSPEERAGPFALLAANVPAPSDLLSALVYGADFESVEPDNSAAEAVDDALSYRPLITPAP